MDAYIDVFVIDKWSTCLYKFMISMVVSFAHLFFNKIISYCYSSCYLYYYLPKITNF
jgi:hypothetical protein